ncbi:MAG: glycosyltransferase [Thermoleophilia bacterium]|nr:glycosyltransferase [Thermoleophilia bacterium]
MPTPQSVSIIVATWNAAATLEACLASIAAQTHPAIELVVADGASSDATVEIAQRYEPAVLISEPDDGIYDAWNKALRQATGDWVLFLGADDVLAHPNAIAHLVAAGAAGNANLVSAKCRYIGGHEIGQPWNVSRLRWYQNIAHPAMLQARSLFIDYGDFDTSFRIAGDYDLLLRIAPFAKAAWLDEVICELGPDGVSQTQLARLRREIYAAQKKNSTTPSLGAAAYFCLLNVAALRRWRPGSRG